MGRELFIFQMETFIKDMLKKIFNKVKGFIHGRTKIFMKENLKIIKRMDKEGLNVQMEIYLMDNG